MKADEFLNHYASCTNTHDFDEMMPLICEDAVFWFNDGSHKGRESIRHAFEKTWNMIREERYAIEDVQSMASSDSVVVFIYTFRWEGLIQGKLCQGRGRGTSVITKTGSNWKVVHEHLSPVPRVHP